MKVKLFYSNVIKKSIKCYLYVFGVCSAAASEGKTLKIFTTCSCKFIEKGSKPEISSLLVSYFTWLHICGGEFTRPLINPFTNLRVLPLRQRVLFNEWTHKRGALPRWKHLFLNATWDVIICRVTPEVEIQAQVTKLVARVKRSHQDACN